MTVTSHQSEGEQSPQDLQRKLSNRHLQLIAIGGAIGTGLFMGSGKTISLAGPSILFIYMIIGGMFFFLMRALGELLLANLHYKSFVDMAHDLIGPWAGYYMGWTYWLGCAGWYCRSSRRDQLSHLLAARRHHVYPNWSGCH
ncbi:D-serine/D-alanine/glycine transporter [Acinetobacter proteolyticus]|uniref:D-serine/D-alanine/glycine transporter n=1 Tax=Acinetobacter proteolyticus TaxID=1776741 RepID=A0ABN0JA23_9GAMM|nr:D-serine/D-alanine/glycine transporter [Acinetobacter proteolyticus]